MAKHEVLSVKLFTVKVLTRTLSFVWLSRQLRVPRTSLKAVILALKVEKRVIIRITVTELLGQLASPVCSPASTASVTLFTVSEHNESSPLLVRAANCKLLVLQYSTVIVITINPTLVGATTNGATRTRFLEPF